MIAFELTENCSGAAFGITLRKVLASMPKFIAALLAVLLLAGCSSIPLLSGEFRITAEELTEKMAVRFPLEKSVAGLLDVTLVRPRVELLAEQQRIVTSFDVSVKLALSGKSVAGTLKISARPEYIAASRSLFLRDARVDQIRIDNMPDALSAALAKAASNFGRMPWKTNRCMSLNRRN